MGTYGDDSTTTAIINGSDLSTINQAGNANGAVYTFNRSGSTWAFESYLKAPNNSNLDVFGLLLDMSEDTIAVAAYSEDSSTTSIINGSNLDASNNSGNDNGAVYIFRD